MKYFFLFFTLLFSVELLLGEVTVPTKIDGSNEQEVERIARLIMNNAGYYNEFKIARNATLTFNDSQGFEKSLNIGVWHKIGTEGCAIRLARIFIQLQNTWVQNLANRKFLEADSLNRLKAHTDTLKMDMICKACEAGNFKNDTAATKLCQTMGCTYEDNQVSTGTSFWSGFLSVLKWICIILGAIVLIALLYGVWLTLQNMWREREEKEQEKRAKLISEQMEKERQEITKKLESIGLVKRLLIFTDEHAFINKSEVFDFQSAIGFTMQPPAKHRGYIVFGMFRTKESESQIEKRAVFLSEFDTYRSYCWITKDVEDWPLFKNA